MSSFISKILVKTVTAGLLTTALLSSCSKNNDDKADYIFLFIGDGMGSQNVALTESYLSYKAGKIGGEQLCFTTFPYYGMADTYSANFAITCSAASGTAIATGSKTLNRNIGVDAEGNPVKSIAYELQEDDYNIGIISSVPLNHATPAAFYTNAGKRYKYYEIMKSLPQSGFKFFAGSGFIKYFGKDNKEQSSAEYLRENGYNVCFSEEEFEKADKDAKIILCQPYNKETEPANYDVGGPQPEGHITLSRMVENALELFSDKKPFFIMCEGGEIDWAAHSNKVMPTVKSVIAFDDAIRVAYEFYKKHPDKTLIVVTSDHETGGASLGTGTGHRESIGWAYLDSVYTANNSTNRLTDEENRELNWKANIGWTSQDHTGGAVPVYAIGKGAERFCGRMDNTEIKAKILAEEPCK